MISFTIWFLGGLIKKHEVCYKCNIPEWVVQNITNNITSFTVDIKIIDDQIVITKFYKVSDI
jgi:hypothetical protein